MKAISKKHRILNAATIVFTEKGYHAAKVSDVAKMAGIGKGTVYEYFESKKEIFEEALIAHFKKGYEEMAEIFNAPVPFKEKLRHYLAFKFDYIASQSSLAENFLAHNEFISVRIKESFITYMTMYYKKLIELVDQGIQEEVLRKEIDRELMAGMIMGISGNYMGAKVLHHQNKTVDYDGVIESLLKGFGKTEED